MGFESAYKALELRSQLLERDHKGSLEVVPHAISSKPVLIPAIKHIIL